MKITVVGIGYVGLSNAILLSQMHKVIAYDVDTKRVEKLNKKQSPIMDAEIENFLQNKKLNLIATSDKEIALSEAEIIIVATPTNYDAETNYFNTESVVLVTKDSIRINPNALIVI